MPISIRLATADDAEGIRQVYAPFISTSITFEEEVPTATAYRKVIEDILAFYPCLVACMNESAESEEAADKSSERAAAADEHAESIGACVDKAKTSRIVGFAYAHRQAERAAYDWNVELSVYLAPEAAGQGLGTMLYRALLDLLQLQGIRCAYARVTSPNAASDALHRRFGFDVMGVQRNAGYKCGAWRDVTWYALPLGAFDDAPEKPLPFPAVRETRQAEVASIVANANESLTQAR